MVTEIEQGGHLGTWAKLAAGQCRIREHILEPVAFSASAGIDIEEERGEYGGTRRTPELEGCSLIESLRQVSILRLLSP
jgi:hypothetical protein